MRRTGYLFDEAGMWHDTGTCAGWFPSCFSPETREFVQPMRHVENCEAKRRCHSLLCVSGLYSRLHSLAAIGGPQRDIEPVNDAVLELVHTREHIETVAHALRSPSATEHQRNVGECVVLGRGSDVIARRAVRCALHAVDAVMHGAVDNAYVLTRPPGHHAEPALARGFCLYNNVAIAAAYLLSAAHDLQRVAIVDFDVHHGNGTEKAFYDDPRVLFLSVHQAGLYPPNSGHAEDVGEGAGRGFNINTPIPPGSGEGCYSAWLTRVCVPALVHFDPQFILVSAGYDACALDPLSHTMLSSKAYATLVAALVDTASRCPSTKGRLVALHEGGYSEVYAPYCCLRAIEALVGVPPETSTVLDPYEGEILSYSFQDLQPHQAAAIAASEAQLHIALIPQ